MQVRPPKIARLHKRAQAEPCLETNLDDLDAILKMNILIITKLS